MPKVAIDYSKTIIYKLIHKDALDDANIYIGSTTNFIERKRGHKSSCDNEKSSKYNYLKYVFIRNNGGWDEWNMIEVEKYSCVDNNEARAREEYWKRILNATLNSRQCFTTNEERAENNKRNSNPEKDRERSKVYYYNNMEKVKAYREDNKEARAENYKMYCKENAGKIKERNATKIKCDVCGSVVQKYYLKEHQNRVICKSFLKSIPLVE